MAVGGQPPDEMAADEPGRARDRDTHLDRLGQGRVDGAGDTEARRGEGHERTSIGLVRAPGARDPFDREDDIGPRMVIDRRRGSARARVVRATAARGVSPRAGWTHRTTRSSPSAAGSPTITAAASPAASARGASYSAG